MRQLGELLLDRGAIAVGELHTALEAVHRTGGRLGTHLLRLGFVEEKALLEALSEQCGVPFVPSKVLLGTSQLVRGLVPLPDQRRLMAAPFEQNHGRLAVAMVNPRDLGAIEEISKATGLAVEPHVATETTLLRHLGTGRGDDGGGPSLSHDVAHAGSPDLAAWERLWSPPRVGPEALEDWRPRQAGTSQPLVSTFPELIPMIDVSDGLDFEAGLDMKGLSRHLAEVRERDQVGALLLRFASGFLSRASLFAVHSDKVTGWMVRGEGLVLDDVQSLLIPLDQPSVFLNLLNNGAYFVGAIPPGEANQILLEVLGDPAPAELVMVPVRVQGRAVAFVLGDNPGEDGAGFPVQELVAAANKAGVALEVLILRNKIRN